MRASHVAVGVVGLAVAGLWYAAGGVAPPPAQAAEQLRVADPLTHANLAVYFIHGPDALDDTKVVSLQEALERGWAVVRETSNVNSLEVENLSADHELFVQSGDLIRGGKQDRMIATDMLLPVRSGPVAFPAHCVEHGRWTGRGAEASGHFATSNNCAVGKDLKLANASLNQSEVWKQVAENQKKLNDNLKTDVTCPESRTSLQLTLENRTLQEKVGDFEKALLPACEGRAGVVGVVFVVNGKVSGAEVYGSCGLFQKAWPKLLRSAAVEALAEKPKDRPAACPSAREVEAFLATASKAEGAPANRTAAEDITFAGRSGATSNRTVSGNGGQQAAEQLRQVQASVDNVVQTEGRAGRGPARYAPEPAGQRGGRASGSNADPAVGQQALRQQFAVNDTPLDNSRGQPAPLPMGNRLNVNRVENPSAVTIEARDMARPSAVIHRSVIAK